MSHHTYHSSPWGFSMPSQCPELVDFTSPTTSSRLNSFINDHLQPTSEFNREMNETVDNICSFLRHEMKASRIVKGGSLGKGTAVKGMSDVDLVLVLNEVRDARDLKSSLPGLQNKIKQKLRDDKIPKAFKVVQFSISETRFAVKFTVEGRHGKIDVDLLPTFSHTADLRSLYRKMIDDEYTEYYSASLVQEQVNFVKRCQPMVKSLIRLVKYWNKEKVMPTCPGERVPTSYVLELITIYLWERQGSPRGFDMLKAFRGVMSALNDSKSLDVVWGENYERGMVRKSILKQRPLVMDPANPTKNVAGEFSFVGIGRAAERVLRSRMLESVTSDDW